MRGKVFHIIANLPFETILTYDLGLKIGQPIGSKFELLFMGGDLRWFLISS
jgi:hypothetical protein